MCDVSYIDLEPTLETFIILNSLVFIFMPFTQRKRWFPRIPKTLVTFETSFGYITLKFWILMIVLNQMFLFQTPMVGSFNCYLKHLEYYFFKQKLSFCLLDVDENIKVSILLKCRCRWKYCLFFIFQEFFMIQWKCRLTLHVGVKVEPMERWKYRWKCWDVDENLILCLVPMFSIISVFGLNILKCSSEFLRTDLNGHPWIFCSIN